MMCYLWCATFLTVRGNYGANPAAELVLTFPTSSSFHPCAITLGYGLFITAYVGAPTVFAVLLIDLLTSFASLEMFLTLVTFD